jgi:hypothetical protein
MQQFDLSSIGFVWVIIFLLLFILMQSFLVGLAALIVGMPERSIKKALFAGSGVVLILILINSLGAILPPIIVLPIAVLLPSILIQRVYDSSIGRALLTYILSVLIVVIVSAVLPQPTA